MKKKGFTLVEVLVSITLFSIMIGAIISCFLLAKSSNIKHKEYLYFEEICLEIDAYYDKYQSNWEEKYFINSNPNHVYYYDSNYKLVSNDGVYELSFVYENNEMILSVKNLFKNYYVIENLNYGGYPNA